MRFHLSFDCQSFLRVFVFSPPQTWRKQKENWQSEKGNGKGKKEELNLRASKALLIISAVGTINLALRLYKIYQTGNTWVQYNRNIYHAAQVDFIYLWKIENIKKTTCSAWLQRTKGGNVCVINLMSKWKAKGEEGEIVCRVAYKTVVTSCPLTMQSGAI